MTNRFMRIPAVMETTGKSRSAIYADIANGSFPKSILIGARSVAWVESDIAAWIKAKIDAAKPKQKIPFPSDQKQSWEHLSKEALALEVKRDREAGLLHASEI